MLNQPRILIVDDDHIFLESLKLSLTGSCHIETAATPEEGLNILGGETVDIVITDLIMPNMDGLEFIRKARSSNPRPEFILLTGNGSSDSATEAIRCGAFDYITKPCKIDQLLFTIQKVERMKELERNNEILREQLAAEQGSEILLGTSSAIRNVVSLLARVAPNDIPVLLTGSGGTGKDLVANTIHQRSKRVDQPLIKINCSASSESELERDLLGWKKGAFKEATCDQPGAFQKAHRGTLLLREIGDLPPNLQALLMQVLSEKQMAPLGSNTPVPAHIRLIAATDRDLEEIVEAGRFREDLFCRLDVAPIRLPDLSERHEDIIPLTEHFCRQYASELNKRITSLTKEAAQILASYSWPGNTRELQNAVERAVVLCRGNALAAADLPLDIREQVSSEEKIVLTSRNWSIREMERELIKKVLYRQSGNIKRSAELLGITRATLYNKLGKYQIDRDDLS